MITEVKFAVFIVTNFHTSVSVVMKLECSDCYH